MVAPFHSDRFSNITISGRVASGATTLYNNLKKPLAPLGWKFFSGGEYMREYAVQNKLFPKNNRAHHAASVYSDDFDRLIDGLMKKRLTEESHLVIEADLAGFNAKDIPKVFKILLECDDALRIDRLVNRDQITVEEAKQHLREREEENIKKWKRLYGDYNFWDPKFYDLVIDTYKNGPTETLNLALEAIGNQK